MFNKTLYEKSPHKNSQKRFYEPHAVYFITTVTNQRFPYFEEAIFCQLFIENLRIVKHMKQFKLFGFIILPDHIHLLIKVEEKFNISEIMFSIKKHFSHDVNRIMGENELFEKYRHVDEGGQTFARLLFVCPPSFSSQNSCPDRGRSFFRFRIFYLNDFSNYN
ncbi:MAG: transposase [bacterium]|nr:transposase [bacterium]